MCDYKLRQNYGRYRKDLDSEGSEVVLEVRELRDSISERTPNPIMNVPVAIPTRSSVWIWVFIGLLVQSVVFVVDGLGVFHYHWPRSKSKVASYGFST